jgi:hypothetical protein
MQDIRLLLNNVWDLALDDNGNAQFIAYLSTIPLILLAMLTAFQFILVGYAGIVASGAAREGAVTAARGGNITAAVVNASPGFDGRRRWRLLSPPCSLFSNQMVTVEVTLEVPHVTFVLIGPLESYPRVTTQSSAKCEIGYTL